VPIFFVTNLLLDFHNKPLKMSNFLEDMRLFLLGFPNPVGLDREKTYRIFQNPTGLVQYLQRERERERERVTFSPNLIYTCSMFLHHTVGFLFSVARMAALPKSFITNHSSLNIFKK